MGNSTHATALREDEPQAKTDRQSATAKEEKSKRAYDNRTSIPYGKGKDKYLDFPLIVSEYQFPMGKVKSLEEFTMKRRIVYQFPMGKVKEKVSL